MADPREMPDDYVRSRAALRERFGSRRIDARAPYSAADTTPSAQKARATGNRDDTPSGRQRFMRQEGKTEAQIAEQENMDWRNMFKSAPAQDARPMARMAPIIQPVSAGLDIAGQMLAARQAGATSGTFRTPYGTAGFSLAPSTPPNATELQNTMNILPKPTASLLPTTTLSAFGRTPRPSVLSGASKWLIPV